MTTFCVQADVERLFSSYGVMAFSDHDNDGLADADVITDVIQEASDDILMFLHERYTEATLATSSQVTRWCALVACYKLCMRRGNPIPESIANEYERLLDPKLGIIPRIASAELSIAGLVLRCDFRPSWSNLQVNRRYRYSKDRVTPTNSSDSPTTLTKHEVEHGVFYDG